MKIWQYRASGEGAIKSPGQWLRKQQVQELVAEVGKQNMQICTIYNSEDLSTLPVGSVTGSKASRSAKPEFWLRSKCSQLYTDDQTIINLMEEAP